MKVVILAGGFGTRISEESSETETDDRDRGEADFVAYYEDVFQIWI